MFSLIKRHFLMHSILSYILIVFLMAFLYIGTIPPYFLFFVIIIAFIITLFYDDEKHSMNRYMISLPVSKKMIVRSRYYSAMIMAFLIICFQYILMLFVRKFINGPHYIYHWQDFIILICFTMIISSVIILIYYSFQSFILSTTILMFGLVFTIFILIGYLVNVLNMNEIIFNDMDRGFPLLVEKYMPFQPYVSFLVLSTILFFASMKGSEKVLRLKDI